MDITLALPLFFGWLAAAIVNYLADVLPHTRRFSEPVCLQCQKAIHWLDYLTLQNKNGCGHSRSIRTWITQISGMVISVYIWISPPAKLGYALGIILLLYFGTVLIIDLEHRLILHPTSIVGAFLAFALGILMHGLVPTLIGGVAGFGIMFALYMLGVLFARQRTKKMLATGMEADDEESLGFGDVFLAGILGLLLGWPIIWFGLLLGILLGGAVSLFIVVIMLVSKRYKEQAMMIFIPYGPYFIISAFALIYLPTWIQAAL